MNIGFINAVADAIEASPDSSFHMGDLFDNVTYPKMDETVPVGSRRSLAECGSAGCIAGHALDTAWRADVISSRLGGTTVAARLMGLSPRDALRLFEPHPTGMHGYSYWSLPGDRGHITREHAVAALRRVASVGRVDVELWRDTDPSRGDPE